VELVLTVAVLVAAGAVVIGRRRRMHRGRTVDVTADAEGVRRLLADGRREEVSWSEVSEVEVFTAAMGPHGPSGGAVVLFGDAERGCIVPLDRLGDSGLLEHAHRLPGFDPATVVAAVRDPGVDRSRRAAFRARPMPRTVVCWRRGEE
jgi:hypothetical protein